MNTEEREKERKKSVFQWNIKSLLHTQSEWIEEVLSELQCICWEWKKLWNLQSYFWRSSIFSEWFFPKGMLYAVLFSYSECLCLHQLFRKVFRLCWNTNREGKCLSNRMFYVISINLIFEGKSLGKSWTHEHNETNYL